MKQREMTTEDLLVAIAKTYPFGREARLSDDDQSIINLHHHFKSDKEEYVVAFSIPATMRDLDFIIDDWKITMAEQYGAVQS